MKSLIHIHVYVILVCYTSLVKAKCPNWCSGRGTCTNPSLDADQFCICDVGYTGEDCSMKICPKAYDFLALPDPINYRTVRLSTAVESGKLSGLFGIKFGLSSTLMNADANEVNNNECKAIFMGLKGIDDVSCIRENYDSNTGTGNYLISILRYPMQPQENNIFTHTGNPALNFFHCNISTLNMEGLRYPTCTFNDVITTNLPLYKECSGHGDCNYQKGICKCHAGFKGALCDDIRDDEDIIVHDHGGPFFTASVVKIKAGRDMSMDYNLIQTQIQGSNITTFTGDGRILHENDINMRGVLAIGSKWMNTLIYPFSKISSYLSKYEIPRSLSTTDKYHSGYTDKPSHYIAMTDDTIVTEIDVWGNIKTLGSLSAGNNSLLIENGIVHAENGKFSGSLDVIGAAHIDESLTVGSTFAISSTGVTVDVNQPVGTLFELTSRSPTFSGSLLELKCHGNTSTMIKSIVDGMTTFEVSSGGYMNTRGMKIHSGGLNIHSGGLQVLSGGLDVSGGLSVSSGGLHLHDQSFSAGSLLLQNNHSTTTTTTTTTIPLLHLKNENPSYSSSMIELTSVATHPSTSISTTSGSGSSKSDKSILYSYIQAKHKESSDIIFDLRHDGHIMSQGGLSLHGPAGLSVDSYTHLLGGLSVSKRSVSAGTVIDLSMVYESYIIIENDHLKLKNDIKLRHHTQLPPTGATTSSSSSGRRQSAVVMPGEVMIISNQDEHSTHGDIEIPGETTVLLIYDGQKWQDIHALKAAISEIRNLRVLEAINDIDLGNVTFTSHKLRAKYLTRGSVLLAGLGGILTERPEFTYMNQVLSVPRLKIEKIESSIDMQGNTLMNGILSNTKFINSQGTFQEISIPGMSGLAYFDPSGKLSYAKGINFDTDGKIFLDQIHSHMDIQGNQIYNTHIHSAKMSNISEIKVDKLLLTSISVSGQSPRSSTSLHTLATLSPSGELRSSQDGLRYDSNTHTLHIDKLNGFNLTATADFNHHSVYNMNVYRGNMYQLNNIDTDNIRINSLSTTYTTKDNTVYTSDKKVRLVYSTTEGKLVSTDQLIEAPIILNKAQIHDLVIKSSIDGSQSLFKNIKLDPATVDYGIIPKFNVQSLIVHDLEDKTLMKDQLRLVGSTMNGGLSIPSNAIYISSDNNLHTPKLVVSDTLTASSIKISSLKSITSKTPTNSKTIDNPVATSVLTTDTNGEIISSNTLKIPQINITESIQLHEKAILIIPNLKRMETLLTMDNTGQVMSPSDDVTYQISSLSSHKIQSKQLHVMDQATLNTLILPNLYPSTAGNNKDKKTKTAIDDLLPKVLSVDTNGVVKVSDQLSSTQLHTTALKVTGDAHIENLYINNFHPNSQDSKSTTNSSIPSNLLAISPTGKLVQTSTINIQELKVSNTILIENVISMSKNGIIDKTLLQSDFSSATSSASVSTLLKSVNQVPVVVNKDGRLMSSPDLTINKLVTLGDTVIQGKLSINQLHFTTEASKNKNGNVLVLSADGSGSVQLQNTITMNQIYTDSLVVKNELSTPILRITDLQPKKGSVYENIVLSDSKGYMSSISSSEWLQNALVTLPPPDTITQQNVNIKKTLVVHTVQLDMKNNKAYTSSGGFLQADVNGVIQVIDKKDLTFDYLNIQELSIKNNLITPSITINSLSTTSNTEGIQRLLSADKSGKIVPLPIDTLFVTTTTGIVTIKSLQLEQLQGSITASGCKIDGIEISNSKIKSSHIIVSGNPSYGDMVVRKSDGQLAYTNHMTIDENGILYVKSIQTSDSSTPLTLINPHIKKPLIQGGRIENLEILNGQKLDISGEADVRGNMYIGGSLDVSGSVVGSGPYMDSSDIRFKKNVQTIQNALSKVISMNSVTFDYNTEDYPEKKFPSQTQVGFIADELLDIMPELVGIDEQGYKHVAYARATVLVAAAIKELREELSQEMKQLKMELQMIRTHLNL